MNLPDLLAIDLIAVRIHGTSLYRIRRDRNDLVVMRHPDVAGMHHQKTISQ